MRASKHCSQIDEKAPVNMENIPIYNIRQLNMMLNTNQVSLTGQFSNVTKSTKVGIS